MRSLRGQLGLAVGSGAFLVTLVAAVLVGFERWQEESASLQQLVELDSFRLSEIEPGEPIDTVVTTDHDGFGLLFGETAEIIDQVGEVDETVLALAVDVWIETTEQDFVFTLSFTDEDGTEIFVAGVACVDQTVCDTAVVARRTETLVDFLLDRIGWLLGLPALVAGLTVAVARWMVGRSLRPVEAMRAEAAVITASELDRRIPNPGTGDELEQLAATFNDTLGRLEASSEATERFAADAAHELRSPLTGIRAAVELRAGGDELLTDAIGELDRANRLIDDLLLLARSEASPAQGVEVDLDDLVREDVATARIAFPAVTFETDLEPARLLGDQDRLRRVVANLIENAADHCQSRVAVSLRSLDGSLRLIIDDDGPGIPGPERERVFERFARLDESRARSTGGSGLGLALVAEIVGDHGGTVTIGEAPLGGARLEVTLPGTR